MRHRPRLTPASALAPSALVTGAAAALAMLAMLAGLSLAGCSSAPPSAGTDEVWTRFVGSDPSTPAFPDYCSNYFAYAFDRTPGEAEYTGLRIRGDFGYARYMSYNIYQAETGTSVGALTDQQMVPLSGSVNPFLPGTDPRAAERGYQLIVQPEGYPAASAENLLTFDPAGVQTLAVIVRYSAPERDETAGVPLPTIEAYDVRTQETVPLPVPRTIGNADMGLFEQRARLLFVTMVDDTLRFYRSAGRGQFANADSLYLVAAVSRTEGEVLILRFKPPTFPRDSSEYGHTQVRYWSLTQCNPDSTAAFGMRDEEFTPASDGFVYVAIGDESIRVAAEAREYCFMPWTIEGDRGMILYRNTVTGPDFAGDMSRVPVIDPLQSRFIYEQDAKNYIGDCAPTGRRLDEDEFLSSDSLLPPAPR